MKKTKNLPTQRHKITTIFGYSLFAVMAVSFLVTTVIPMTFALHYPTARHFNIIVLVVVFAVATILPAFTAYFIGDKSTRSTKETLHHYNGVLFGFTAYWVAMFTSWIGFSTVFGVSDQPYPVPLIATNVAPAVLTIIIMGILAVVFAKKQNKNASVLQYVPYQLTLIISVVGTFIAPYVSDSSSISFGSIGNLMIPVVITGIAYVLLRKQKIRRLARLSDALIALSIGWITVWVADSFLAFLQLPYPIAGIPAYVVGVVVFGLYLYLRTRKSY